MSLFGFKSVIVINSVKNKLILKVFKTGDPNVSETRNDLLMNGYPCQVSKVYSIYPIRERIKFKLYTLRSDSLSFKRFL